MKRSLVWLALTGVLGSTAVAQSPGTVEFGGFGRYTKFDNSLNVENAFGGGARLGVFFLKDIAVEVDQYYTKSEFKTDTAQQASNYPIHARIVGGIPIGTYDRILLGGGYVRNYYRTDLNGEDDGFTGLIGLRKGFGSSISLRAEGTIDYIPEPFNESATVTKNINYGAQLGLSILIGNEPKVKDSDKDGVLDSADSCPNTPLGDAVDATGCSLPKDADGDTVTDDKDACPNTPAGDKVDARGCSLPKDSDGDTVTDDKDACPNTPAGTQVDAMGCRILFEEGKTALVLEGVNFETGKSEITPNAQTILDVVASSLKANTDVKVTVSGHTDITGSRALNRRLSQARAAAVRDYLIAQGVDAAQITGAAGFGPDRPIASNNTVEGRAQNRRVELNRVN